MDSLRKNGCMKHRIWLIIGLILFSALALQAQQLPLPSGSGPFGTAVIPDTGIAVVADRNSDSVSILDLNTNSVKTTLKVGVAPTDVAINPVTNRAVVTNFGDDTVSIIDLAGQTVVATVAVGPKDPKDPAFRYSPRAVTIDITDNLAIVANLNSGGISLIDLNTNTMILPAQLVVGASPISVGYYPDSNYALVANNQSSSVTVIDIKNRVLIRNIGVGVGPVDIAMNLKNKRAYVANAQTNNVSVIDLQLISTPGSDPVIATIAMGLAPSSIDINPNTNIGAVVSSDSRSMSLINLADNTKLTTVITGIGDTPSNVTVNTAKNTALITSPTNDTVYISSLGFVNYLPLALDSETYRSNLGLTNISGVEVNFTIELFDKDGKSLGKAAAKVAAHGFFQINNVNRFILGTTAVTNTVASLRVNADQPFSSFISMINNATNDPAIQIGRSIGYSKLIVNAVTNAGNFRSKMVILNLGNAIGATKFTARNPETGEVLAAKTDIFVPVGGFYLTNDILADMGLNGKFGPLEIESPNLQPLIVVTLVESTGNTGGFLEAVAIQ